MAQRTLVLLTCDVHDGDADAVETVQFTVEGRSYECDLCDDHLAEFRESAGIWSSHARPVGRTRVRRTQQPAGSPSPASSGRGRSRSTSSGPSTAEVRRWAKSQGIDIGDRGRISSQLYEAYQAAP